MFAACVVTHAQKRAFTFEDMMKLKRVGDPVVSPDGKWVMYSAMDVNLDANTKRNHLWLVPVAGGEAKQITNSPAGESRGRFAPDGRSILFISARDGGSQIWLQDFDSANGALSGDPKRLTNISTEADGASWSPDGKNIVFISEVYAECENNPAGADDCNKARDASVAAQKARGVVFNRLFIRHWSSYSHFKRSHLFVVAADGTGEAAVPRDITPGDHDVPPFNLGGQDFFAISPDGKQVAYTSDVAEFEPTSTNNDIFIVPIEGGTPKKISTSPGSDSTPLYSPDGKYIAWRMQKINGFESDRFRLVVYDRTSGKITNLTEAFDRWVETIVWSPDSKDIYFTSEDKGEMPMYRVAASGGAVKEVERAHNDELQFAPDGKTIVFTRVSIQHPNEVYAMQMGVGQQAVALTHMNDAIFAQVFTSPLEPFWFTGSENHKVQGFIVKPPNFDASKKYPVKFLIHGGPQGEWDDSWTLRWNAQLFAAGGYVVVMINPRGSVGYGQQFTNDVSGDWGGRAYQDLMLGLDYVETKYPYIQKGNVCAMGGSYGGYMVDWMIGHTNRFKCAVAHDGIFNLESSYGSTEELWFIEWEMKGTPWTNREMYRKWSPDLSAQNMKTPTLIVHGQLDYRIDLSQGIEAFTTLQRLKVPSKFLYFPDEGHWVLKPQNSRLWYETVNGWVDKYLKGQAPTR